ncbi:MAG: nucleotidyltransferase domain-containing protein [Sulfuricella sp.]|nr:nucleotidyltransferase domain-containing protein [Sulfuricella sp.]
MLTRQTIQAAAERLASAASAPCRVILFGSYARDAADEGSDLDFMVIEREVADKGAEYLRLRKAVGGVGTGVDLLVYPLNEFERRSQVPGTVPYWACKEGKVLHDGIA